MVKWKRSKREKEKVEKENEKKIEQLGPFHQSGCRTVCHGPWPMNTSIEESERKRKPGSRASVRRVLVLSLRKGRKIAIKIALINGNKCAGGHG